MESETNNNNRSARVMWFTRNTQSEATALYRAMRLSRSFGWTPIDEPRLICGAWSFKAAAHQ